MGGYLSGLNEAQCSDFLMHAYHCHSLKFTRLYTCYVMCINYKTVSFCALNSVATSRHHSSWCTHTHRRQSHSRRLRGAKATPDACARPSPASRARVCIYARAVIGRPITRIIWSHQPRSPGCSWNVNMGVATRIKVGKITAHLVPYARAHADARRWRSVARFAYSYPRNRPVGSPSVTLWVGKCAECLWKDGGPWPQWLPLFLRLS